MAWTIITVWLKSLLNWRMKSNDGRRTRPWLRSAIAQSWTLPLVSAAIPMNESHWISDTARLQYYYREMALPVYVGAIGDGQSEAFYSLGDLVQWYMEMGLDMKDPIWDYIDQLAHQELADAAESDDA